MDCRQHTIQDKGFERIAPTALDVAPLSIKQPSPGSKPLRLWLSVAASGLLLLVVFVWLPGQYDRVSIEPDNIRATSVDSARPYTVNRSQATSPWQQAQWEKQRQQSQQALAELLRFQEELEIMAVEQWAARQYQQALNTAKTADQLYQQKDYLAAAQHYQQSAQQLQTLLKQAEVVFTNTLQQAVQQLNANNSGAAQQAFELALAIKPDSIQAKQGLYRAKRIDEILSLKAQADQLLKEQKIDQALVLYDKALALDRQSTLVIKAIETVRQQIQYRDFNGAMASGYSALQQGQFSFALEQFNRALDFNVSAEKKREATIAIQQASDQQALFHIERQRELAMQLERDEQWQKAIDTYRAVLVLDANLDFAKRGLTRSLSTLALHNQLIDTINAPQRLRNEAVYQQAQRLSAAVQKLTSPGPKLSSLREQLSRLLVQAVTPVAVTLQSDANTDVTVYQVARIGSFTHYTLKLKPGRYTVVGSRDGFKDVRHEFEVTYGQQPPPLVIQCEEKI